ncbi:MAG: hypothetical protein ACRDRK_13505 [Pseudonocardia sp.]
MGTQSRAPHGTWFPDADQAGQAGTVRRTGELGPLGLVMQTGGRDVECYDVEAGDRGAGIEENATRQGYEELGDHGVCHGW